MDSQEFNKSIEQILRLDLTEELEVVDENTKILLDPEHSNPGCKVSFVGSYKRNSETDTWTEYRVLYKVVKFKDTAEYLVTALDFIKEAMNNLKKVDCDTLGIQEVYCIDPFNYYILLYVIK